MRTTAAPAAAAAQFVNTSRLQLAENEAWERELWVVTETAEVKGVLHTLLDYGNVHVQTAGEVERFHFEDIPNPNGVAKMILELAEKDREEHPEEAVEDFGMADRK